MRFKYSLGDPKVRMKVTGPRGDEEYDAYLDTDAARTLIPERDAMRLGLPYVGDTTIITGSGKDSIKLFYAKILFLGREFKVFIFGRDMPEQAKLKAIVGRDILDRFKVCFNGVSEELEIL